jgi:transposase-like protein
MSEPVAGVDYPRNWTEFDNRFPSDAECAAFLGHLRWPGGFICPACGHDRGWRKSRYHLLECASPACRRQTSVTAGTIFDKTRTPLRTWFAAIWFVVSQKHGVSALGLQRTLGFGSYQTAWTMLHKIRKAMVRPDREPLRGTVEVDETYVGGTEFDVRGRKTAKKAIVAIAVEINPTGRGIGRVRLARVPNVTAKSLVGFILRNIEAGATVRTDGLSSYRQLGQHGYTHEAINIKASGDPAHVTMPAVHRIASLLKRWWLGTHHGAMSPEHFDAYLEEYVFRFNRRTSMHRGLLFRRVLEQAVRTDPAPYHELVGGRP